MLVTKPETLLMGQSGYFILNSSRQARAGVSGGDALALEIQRSRTQIDNKSPFLRYQGAVADGAVIG